MTRRFFRFLVAGGIAAMANILSRIGFSLFMPLEAAVVLAYCVGMLVAFVLMRAHVFEASSGEARRQGLKFIGVNVAALLQTLVVTTVLARWVLPSMGIGYGADTVAHVVGVCVPVVTSYFGHKHFSFR